MTRVKSNYCGQIALSDLVILLNTGDWSNGKMTNYHHCMYSMTVTLKLLCPNFKRNNIQYNKQKTPKKPTIGTQSYALIEAVITKQ